MTTIMAAPESIVVLYGGLGSEREVSLRSGAAVARALGNSFSVREIRLDADALPEGIDAATSIVFPALHGGFGEDGRLQSAMDAAGIEYCGCGADASRLCMDKALAKAVAAERDVPVIESIQFDGDRVPKADDVIAALGEALVVQPVDQGSSVGLFLTSHRSELGVAFSRIHEGRWMVERRIRGRELTVGLLHGAAMGVVEVVSSTGVYDYAAKYSPGKTEYRYPAELPPKVEARIKADAETLFDACGCRDFARIDFLLEGERAWFLEINTLPGLTETSLLPKSASCVGYDFDQLAAELVKPAVGRFRAAKGGEGDAG